MPNVDIEVQVQVDQMTAAEARSNARLLSLDKARSLDQHQSATPESDSVFPEFLSAFPESIISTFLELQEAPAENN